MKKHLFPLLLALTTIPHTAISQIKISSPAAAEFVRYGRIPVSYFNGLPDIEIPILKTTSSATGAQTLSMQWQSLSHQSHIRQAAR